MTTAIIWFRRDLRLADNPALDHACTHHDAVIPVYIDDDASHEQRYGEASRTWLHHSLKALGQDLRARGSRLLLFQAEAMPILEQLLDQSGADAVYWNRCYEPEAIERDRIIKETLKSRNITVDSFNASLLYEPWDVLKPDNTPYRVFTPFWKSVCQLGLQQSVPLDEPDELPKPKRWPTSSTLKQLDLLPRLPWHKAMMKHWQIGEAAAHASLSVFLEQYVSAYKAERDMPAIKATSHLSPHLHFGEISPRQIIWQTLAMSSSGGEQIGEATFLKEVGWREFAYYMLYHFPHTLTKPMNPQFEKFPWSKLDKNHLTAWQKGLTGVPIIDAGMRELWATGWMHNRVRMIVASYLTKNLLIHWREGEHWFRDTLVDADIASNVFGWQWTAGSGADAAPYFRIFNPVLQGEKFDKQGEYVRHWVAELKNCPDKFIHKPWEAPEDIRNQLDYPQPIVDLKATRERALDSYKQIKK